MRTGWNQCSHLKVSAAAFHFLDTGSIPNKETKENTNFKPHNLLFEGGHIFEKKVYDELEKVFPNQFVVVFDSEIHKNKNVQFIKNKNNEVKIIKSKK